MCIIYGNEKNLAVQVNVTVLRIVTFCNLVSNYQHVEERTDLTFRVERPSVYVYFCLKVGIHSQYTRCQYPMSHSKTD